MKLAYQNTNLQSPRDSFLAERRKDPYFGSNWHYHEEFEILLIIKGHGVRVVGDNMSQFGDNQLVLMGSPGETYTIRHDTIDRKAYMPGVLKAIQKIGNYQSLVYGLEKLIF
mgnify:CR=1 FL=1